ncbi:MAG TPA: DUF2341 domain-containing protein, partial [Candidatus Woesebacteria bacterium]|nr:DUF2341 domain-containing protein [Candidatus Woesebacteria bacterium]
MTRLSLKSLLIIIVVLLIGIVGLWQIQRKAQPVKADWFNESWMYRKSIGISNASGTNQSNFRVNLSIGTSSLIAAGKMKSDCTDVRLTDIQGKLLPHWVQTGTCNTDATVIWTKIPFLSTSANLIYFYYGNPSADDITDSSVLPDSCSTVNAYLGSGLHYVDPDGKTGQNPFQAYCDMTTDGGGWSLVASWGTAPEWTKTSTSTAAVVGGTTPVNTVSANFGNVVINDFRILASDTATTIASNAYADWYYHYNTATTWKEVWAPTPNKGGDLVHTYRSTTPRQALKPFNYAYNLRFSYQVTQTYNNLSDWGISDQYAGCLPDYWAALTSPGNPFGVYSLSYYSGANGANCSGSVGDGSLGICPSNQSGCIAGQDMSTNNAKIGYDDGNACAGFASVGTTNVGELPGVQANTKLWWFIRRSTPPASVAYAVASAGSEESSPAPIAYWKFDEGVGTTVYDSSSNQNNGVFGAGSSAPTWQSEDMCITGKCLLFDGSKTYLGIGMTNNINQIFTSFTVSAWIKFSSNPATQRGIVSKGSASGNNRFDLNLETNGKIRFWFSSSGNTAFSKSALSINTWHHIVGIWNGTQSIVYVDGIAGTAINNSPSVTISSDPIYIGSWNRESPWFFNGYIDEVKIYAYARTPAQIKQDYQAGRAKMASNKGG